MILGQEGVYTNEAKQPFVLSLDEMKLKSGLIFNKKFRRACGIF